MNKVAVIIPFYQRSVGLLRRAVESIFVQDVDAKVDVIVADDGSPIRADVELEGIVIPVGFTLTIVRQGNRGPGAARNLAIENTRPDTNYVALLDSDDYWFKNHLEKALVCLTHGSGFYFARCEFEKGHRQNESEAKFSTFVDKLPSSAFGNPDYNLFMVERFPLARFLQYSGQIFTSSVVYDYRRYSELRFREELPNGQDVTFFVDLLIQSPPVAFSRYADIVFGKGLNIWASAAESPFQSARLCINEMKMLGVLSESLSRMLGEQTIVRAKRRRAALNCAYFFFKTHDIKLKKQILKYWWQMVPKSLVFLWIYPVVVIWRRCQESVTGS